MLLGTQRVNALNHLEIGGCDTIELAKSFGTPLYIIDEAAVRDNCRSYKAAFDAFYPKNHIYYASKAFLCMAMAKLIEQEGFGMDVASQGELYVALKAGFPANRIALHGNNKSHTELSYAVESGIQHIILDNFQEIDLLNGILEAANVDMEVLVRAAPGVDPKTHRLIRTGQSDTKFGFNINDGSAFEAVKRVLASPRMKFQGIHCHIGSQLLETETHEQAADIMVNLAVSIHEATGAEIKDLNIGGGLGVKYLNSHEPPDYLTFAQKVTTPLKAALDKAGLPYPTLMQEPGRTLVAEAGVTLYEIGAIKTVPIQEIPGKRTYVSVDGGLSDNPRPQMYEAKYECIVANRAGSPADTTITIAGKHCETDILIWNAQTANPEPGDILAVQTTGAYNFVMASNYNRFLRPAVIFVNDGKADLVVARQELSDLVRGESVPDSLKD